MSKKILFFIESLRSGGKERRLVELLFYLKQNTDYEVKLLIIKNEIHYDYIKSIDVTIEFVERKFFRKDPLLFFRVYSIAKAFNPDIIHTWGAMTTFYAIPTKFLLKKPIIGNIISNSNKDYNKEIFSRFVHYIDFNFADYVVGNSNAGLHAYGLTQSAKKLLIYNGVRLERFNVPYNKLKLKMNLDISTPFIVIMVASANVNKDYDLFLDISKEIGKLRSDITFVGIGDGTELERLRNRVQEENINNIKLLGKITNVESYIDISDLGVLFSPSEGISNSIIEYMALGKPVITTDTNGGSQEIIEEGNSGYIIRKDIEAIKYKILEILDNKQHRISLGIRGKEIIKQKFSIDIMGGKYVSLYNLSLKKNLNRLK